MARLEARHRRLCDELAVTPEQPPGEIDQWIKDLAVRHRTFSGRLADRQSQMILSEDPDYGDLGPAFPVQTGPGREPMLQLPKPEIPPSPRSSSGRWTATPTGKPQTDGDRCMLQAGT